MYSAGLLTYHLGIKSTFSPMRAMVNALSSAEFTVVAAAAESHCTSHIISDQNRGKIKTLLFSLHRIHYSFYISYHIDIYL